MYDRACFVSDFPWTAVPQRAFGPNRWVMPGEGWFSFIPEPWIPIVYSTALKVDGLLRTAHLRDSFVIRRTETDGALHVWYEFVNDGDGSRLSVQDLRLISALSLDELSQILDDIDSAFGHMTYITSRIPLDPSDADAM